MEAFQISLAATTELQRSKLAQWAETRTRTHTILPGEHTTVFAGVLLEPADPQKFAVTMARNTKNWDIAHIQYTKWIVPLTETEYKSQYGEITPTDAMQTDPPSKWTDELVTLYFDGGKRLSNVIVQKITHYQRTGLREQFRFRCTLMNSNTSDARPRQFWLSYMHLMHSNSQDLVKAGFRMSVHEDVYSEGWDSDQSDGFEYRADQTPVTGSIHSLTRRRR
jgi:hypothetical protein